MGEKKTTKILGKHLRILTVPCLITGFPQLPAAVSSKQTLIHLLCVDLDLVQGRDEIHSEMCSAHVESCVHVRS